MNENAESYYNFLSNLFMKVWPVKKSEQCINIITTKHFLHNLWNIQFGKLVLLVVVKVVQSILIFYVYIVKLQMNKKVCFAKQLV